MHFMFPFLHMAVAWVVGKLYQRKQEIHPYAWFALLLGSIIPDADFALDWTIGTELHRTFTHSLLGLVMGYIIVYYIAKQFTTEYKSVALWFSVGICSHLILDMIWSKGVPLLWPSLLHFSFTGVGYYDPSAPSFLHATAEKLRGSLKLAIFDMGLGAAGVLYYAFRKRIKF